MPLNFNDMLHVRGPRDATRNNYISSSLVSSQELTKRLNNSSTRKSRPMPMTFHRVWKHADCKVMKWYNDLNGFEQPAESAPDSPNESTAVADPLQERPAEFLSAAQRNSSSILNSQGPAEPCSNLPSASPIHEPTQRGAVSTKFRTIERWCDVHPPFLHEYLLIRLADGGICRLERMGRGSDSDAIRRLGCRAHDIIQWFAPGKYPPENRSKDTSKDISKNPPDDWSTYPQELIIQIEFPQYIEFDLLDVLEVCYAVHRTKRSASYTLQRFNCYFMCSTVLATLVRRASAWDRMISNKDWLDILDQAMDVFRNTECEDNYAYFAFGLCDWANSDNPSPRGFLLEVLRETLSSVEWVVGRLKKEISQTLWGQDLGTALKTALWPDVYVVATNALHTRTETEVEDFSSKMKAAFQDNSSDSAGPILPPKLQRVVDLHMHTLTLKYLRNTATSITYTNALRRYEEPAMRSTKFMHFLSLYMRWHYVWSLKGHLTRKVPWYKSM